MENDGGETKAELEKYGMNSAGPGTVSLGTGQADLLGKTLMLL